MIRNLGIVVAVLVSGSLAAGQSAKDDHPRSDTPQMANATYSETIGPLIERKCLHCHSPGGLAPMSFMSYAELRDWAKNSYTPLDALVRTRAMPPWSADPEIGNFTNPEYMTDAEIDLLLRWIESGYPKGDGNYQAPAPRSEWTGGKPDHIFELPTYTVAAARTAEYRLVPVE